MSPQLQWLFDEHRRAFQREYNWRALGLLLQLLHAQRTRKRELEELLAATNQLVDETKVVDKNGTVVWVNDAAVLSIWKRQAENETAYNDTRLKAENVIKTLKKLEGE